MTKNKRIALLELKVEEQRRTIGQLISKIETIETAIQGITHELKENNNALFYNQSKLMEELDSIIRERENHG